MRARLPVAAFGTALIAGALFAAVPASAETAPEHAWTQVVPDSVARSGLQARAVVTSGAACPQLVARTRTGTIRLAMRAHTPAADVVGWDGVRSCRAAVPRGSVRASVGGLRVPVDPPQSWAAVIGDTGCRIEGADPPEFPDPWVPADCNDPAQWPFAAIADRIARGRPAAVIHVGDYIYREADCPSAAEYPDLHPRCAGSPAVNPPGSPNEDDYAVWEADMLRPLRTLMRTAPFVFARGNHELCSRAGTGYMLLLDPDARNARACAPGSDVPLAGDLTSPWSVSVLGRRIAVADSSGATDDAAENVAAYRETLMGAARLGGPGALLATHRPVFGLAGQSTWTDETLQAAARDLGLARSLAGILSGHIHLHEAIRVGGQPPQLVWGNGGTYLDDAPGPVPPFGPLGTASGAPLVPGIAPYPPATAATVRTEFGYGEIRPRRGGAWLMRARTVTGAVTASCEVAADRLDCVTAP